MTGIGCHLRRCLQYREVRCFPVHVFLPFSPIQCNPPSEAGCRPVAWKRQVRHRRLTPHEVLPFTVGYCHTSPNYGLESLHADYDKLQHNYMDTSLPFEMSLHLSLVAALLPVRQSRAPPWRSRRGLPPPDCARALSERRTPGPHIHGSGSIIQVGAAMGEAHVLPPGERDLRVAREQGAQSHCPHTGRTRAPHRVLT